MVWALRYQHSELRGEMEKAQGLKGPDAGGGASPTVTPARDSFVPLSSLKQK
jgi:hypothetical protein